MSAEYSVEEVLAAVKDVQRASDDCYPLEAPANDLARAAAMLTAYADRIEADERAVQAGADGGVGIDCVSHSAEPVAQKGWSLFTGTIGGVHVGLHGTKESVEALDAFIATHPHSPDAADSGRVGLLNGEMLQAGADALDKFVAWETSNDEERYACVEAVWHAMRDHEPTAALAAQGQGDADELFNTFRLAYYGSNKSLAPELESFRRAYKAIAPPASPVGVPDDKARGLYNASVTDARNTDCRAWGELSMNEKQPWLDKAAAPQPGEPA